jgi:hypothetical protein
MLGRPARPAMSSAQADARLAVVAQWFSQAGIDVLVDA